MAVMNQPRFGLKKRVDAGPEADTKHIKSFGEGLNKVDFGSKYKHKYSDTPGPTKYNPDNKLLKTKSQSTFIARKTSTYQRPVE